MARDFSPAVSAMLASAPPPLSAQVDVTQQSRAAQEEAVARATAGDPQAQAQVAYNLYSAARASDRVEGQLLEAAEGWARQSADCCDSGMYRLAEVLLFKSGVLCAMGFLSMGRETATEALDLLDVLADAGYEEAGASIVTASEALAQAGINCRPNEHLEG